MCVFTYVLHAFQVCCPVSMVTRPPFLKREEAAWAQRPHPPTQTRTCPSEDLQSVWRPAGLCERSRTWRDQYQRQWLQVLTSSSLNWGGVGRSRIVLLVLFLWSQLIAKHAHFGVMISFSLKAVFKLHTGGTEKTAGKSDLTAALSETLWVLSRRCFNLLRWEDAAVSSSHISTDSRHGHTLRVQEDRDLKLKSWKNLWTKRMKTVTSTWTLLVAVRWGLWLLVFWKV